MFATNTHKKNAVPTFQEFECLRVAGNWEETSRVMTIDGGVAFDGRVFVRFELSGVRSSCMDFQYRGLPLSDAGAQTFRKLMAHSRHLDHSHLMEAKEILGDFVARTSGGQFVNIIESAKVANLNGRSVLQVQWQSACGSMKCISVFIDALGDGRQVHEIHFYTPVDLYDQTAKHFYDTMRSIQWQAALTPPPMRITRLSQSMDKIAS